MDSFFSFFAISTCSLMEGVVKMRTINKWRYFYYWTKAEKALDEGNEDKYKKYRDKFKRIQLLTIRKG